MNLDFADIRTVMSEMGKAMMGTGEAEGENRSVRAAEAAISNPLLEDTNMAGARGLLINITGGEDMTLFEVDQAANRIRDEVDEEANIIFGSAIDDNLMGKVRVSVVATGIESQADIDARRPRLVAVGGMSAIAPAPVVAGGEGGFEAPQAEPATPSLLAGSFQGGEQRPAAPVFGQAVPAGTAAPRPAGRGPMPPPRQPMPPRAAEPLRPAPVPPVGGRLSGEPPLPRGLFAEAPRPAARPQPLPQPVAPTPPPARSTSLFGIVTGAMRRTRPPAAEPETPAPAHDHYAAQPEPAAEPPRPIVRPATGEESGLDIPAFLRRQSS